MYLGRGTMTERFLSHNFQLPFKQQLSLHKPLPCVILNDNRDNILFNLCATNFSRLLEKFITQKNCPYCLYCRLKPLKRNAKKLIVKKKIWYFLFYA